MISKILPTGTRFVVTEKTTDSSFTPGTTGFMSYVKGRDVCFKNVFYFIGSVIRRGKNGKERTDVVEFSAPIFELPVENAEKFLPDDKRKNYIHIEMEKDIPTNMLVAPEMEYLGWALAWARFVNKLNTKTTWFNVWPKDNDDSLNRIYNLASFFEEDPSYVKETYANNVARMDFTKKIRMLECTLIISALTYLSKVVGLEVEALKDMYEKGLGDSKEVEKNIRVYNEKFKLLELAIQAHKGQNKKK